MQPYFLPYIGYFQLIGRVDAFVLHDTVKYTKKGWINRNRLLRDGNAIVFGLPLRAASDQLHIVEREIAPTYKPDELMSRFAGAYRKAPYFRETQPLLESVLRYQDTNLFGFLRHSIAAVCAHLDIKTRILTTSSIDNGLSLKGQERVIHLCRCLAGDTYVNPIGGRELYSSEAFAAAGISLRYLRSMLTPYTQFGQPFVAALSIVDVLCFNGRDATMELVARDFVVEA